MGKITHKSLILNGLLIATGAVVSDAIISSIDEIIPQRKKKAVVKTLVAGVMVIGTVWLANELRERGSDDGEGE